MVPASSQRSGLLIPSRRDRCCDFARHKRHHVHFCTADRRYLHLFTGERPSRTRDCGIPRDHVFLLPVRPAGHHVRIGIPGDRQGLDVAHYYRFTEPGFIAVFSYLIGIVLGYGEHGIWWGDSCRGYPRGIVSFAWARMYISRLLANP